jgi:hypothetical protein
MLVLPSYIHSIGELCNGTVKGKMLFPVKVQYSKSKHFHLDISDSLKRRILMLFSSCVLFYHCLFGFRFARIEGIRINC